MKIFGREPAIILALIAVTIRLIGAFIIDISADQQAVLNAVASAFVGLLIARAVRREALVPALLGFVQALLALAVGFGFDFSAEQQAVIMSFVGAVAAMYVRTQVVAPVPPGATEVR